MSSQTSCCGDQIFKVTFWWKLMPHHRCGTDISDMWFKILPWTTDIWEKWNMYKDVFPNFLLWRKSVWNTDFSLQVLVLSLGMCIFCLKCHITQSLSILAHLDQGRPEMPAEQVQHVVMFSVQGERSCLFFHICHIPTHLPQRSHTAAAFR